MCRGQGRGDLVGGTPVITSLWIMAHRTTNRTNVCNMKLRMNNRTHTARGRRPIPHPSADRPLPAPYHPPADAGAHWLLYCSRAWRDSEGRQQPGSGRLSLQVRERRPPGTLSRSRMDRRSNSMCLLAEVSVELMEAGGICIDSRT